MTDGLKIELSDDEQEQAREVLQRLLSRGAILREEGRDLYDWACIHRARLDAVASLIGLKLQWEQDSRLIVGIPQSSRLLRRMKQDETLVTLALWYDSDRAVKDEGKAPDEVMMTVREFNQQLEAKFKNLKLPPETRLGEILHLLDRKGIVRLENTVPSLANATIRILPTIRFIIPFQDIEDWNRTRERYQATTPSNTNSSDGDSESEDLTD
jgi:uncharacterized short protein YbdD (DUF466 family)